MATVWLARDLKHDRLVALKVLRPDLAAILGAERFLREIRLTANLQHPHILPLLDSGEAAGLLYYVMPYVEGESLRDRLGREGQLPLEEALRLATEVAEALDYAHEQGVIDRDIKPENILLSRSHALVADFGIALAVTQAGGGRLTETGLSLGTPAYMSPEQATADPRLDGRSDQYSLACVVYELLAGEPPYTGATAQAIIAKRLSEPLPKLTTLRQVPPGVEAALTRALAKAPADRYLRVAEFAAALTRDDASTEPPARSPAQATRLMTWIVRGGAVIAVLGVVALLARRLRHTPAPAVPTHRQFTFTAQAEDPAFSSDGRAIAYVVQRRSLVLEELARRGPVVLVPPVLGLGHPRWSPDGRWLYFTMIRDSTRPAAIYRIPGRGGAPVRVADASGPFDLAPDGRTLVQATGDTLTLLDAASGAERARLPTRRSAAGGQMDEDFDLEHVAWSPDGRWIAFSRISDPIPPDVLVTSADGQRGGRLAEGRGPLRWSPTGDALYYLAPVPGGTDLMRLPFDTRSGSPLGQPRIALSGLPYSDILRPMTFDLRRDGHMLAYGKGPQSLHVWALTIEQNRDTAIARRLSEDSRVYDWPALTRDGTTLAVVQYDGSGQGNFFVVPFSGGGFTALTQGPGYKSNASWAPDGTRFVYVLTDSGGSDLILTDRTGQRQRIGTTAPFPQGFFRTNWSADGRTLFYPAAHSRTLVGLSVEQGSETLISMPDSMGHWLASVVSPDGRQLLAAEWHRAADWFRIWRSAVGGEGWVHIPAPFGNNIPLLWSGDGWIYLFNEGSEATELPTIWRMRPDGLHQELVTHLPVACRLGWVSMSGDARRLAWAVHRLEPDLWLVSDFDPEH